MDLQEKVVTTRIFEKILLSFSKKKLSAWIKVTSFDSLLIWHNRLTLFISEKTFVIETPLPASYPWAFNLLGKEN